MTLRNLYQHEHNYSYVVYFYTIAVEGKSLWDILVQYVIGAISGLFTMFAGCAALAQFITKVIIFNIILNLKLCLSLNEG